MKKTLFLLLILIGFSCSKSTQTKSIDDISWLLGEWVSDDSKEGVVTKELWWNEGGNMLGKGQVIKNGEAAFTELLSLKMVNDTLTYVADVPHNSEPVAFKLTKYTNDSWTFENPDNDFPKSIEYIRNEMGFKAIVSGKKRSFTLNFKKI
ncbi:DUF6265 family protein [Reichenbachiella sp. MALMAid0571]|uniref:DUF6265 family protein n=1 Tax=Reichenbachiella sp. MALMAid0571 TaxID=3143939 RepID=UPI0032DF1CF3